MADRESTRRRASTGESGGMTQVSAAHALRREGATVAALDAA